jgi:hypothetical protein
MPNATFNTVEGQQIQREMLLILLNVNTYASPTWAALGSTVTESSASYDWGEETSQDILGVTRTTLKKPTVTQDFDGVRLYEGDAAYEKIWVQGIQNQDPAALSNLDLLVIHLYAGVSATPFAERYPSSAIHPNSIGGDGGGFIEMPFSATYGGVRETGTVAKDSETGAYTFTRDSE